jgi:hypothetical protein
MLSSNDDDWAKSEMQRRSDPRRLRPTTPDGSVRERNLPSASLETSSEMLPVCTRLKDTCPSEERSEALDDPRFDRRLCWCMVMYETITMETGCS